MIHPSENMHPIRDQSSIPRENPCGAFGCRPEGDGLGDPREYSISQFRL